MWTDLDKMPEGRYLHFVHNYSNRTSNGGFSAKIEYDGQVYYYTYPHNLKGGERVPVAEYILNKQTGIEFIKSLDSTSAVNSKQMWNINTNKFHKVKMLMYSPNYWGNQQAEDNQVSVGNKHYLFMLDNCKADEARGFFNEFLKQKLAPEKKVFEALANKMKVAPSDDQLSGVGFSSTQKTEVVVRVIGKVSRVLRVVV